jgi:[amino group carrier protein]-lysine/ornithine hydrolase
MNDQTAIQLLEHMVRIRSHSTEERPIAEFLVASMRENGFDEAFIDDAGNAVGIIEASSLSTQHPAPSTVVLLGHMDTVPGDVPVRIEDGKLYGRGSVDAKGPLAAFICAAARVKQAGGAHPRIVVVGCVEEEAPSSKGAHFAATAYRGDFCIVGEPSGWDGITLGYKGYLRAVVRLEQGSSHTAHPIPTVSDRACRMWLAIADGAAKYNAGRDKIFDQLMPVLTRITSGSDGRQDWAELRLGIRLPLELPPDACELWLREIVGDEQVTVAGGIPAWTGPRTTPLHRALSRAIRERGGNPVFKVKTGTADLNIIAPAWGCPALAYGPGDAALDHTPDEHIVLDEYLRGIEVLEGTLKGMVSTTASA